MSIQAIAPAKQTVEATSTTKMECVSSTEPAWFTVGAIYDAEPRGPDTCICGDNLVSDLDECDWYEMSQRADGLWFLTGYQQSVLFRTSKETNHDA